MVTRDQKQFLCSDERGKKTQRTRRLNFGNLFPPASSLLSVDPFPFELENRMTSALTTVDIKSLLGVHPDFPQKGTSPCPPNSFLSKKKNWREETTTCETSRHHLPWYFPHPSRPRSVWKLDYDFLTSRLLGYYSSIRLEEDWCRRWVRC